MLRKPRWSIDHSDMLNVLAEELHLKVSYGVFQPSQYVLSRIKLDGKMVYCACRIAGDDIMAVGLEERTVRVCLADPTSIERLEAAIRDDMFMIPAGRDTEQKIIEMERSTASLDEMLRTMKS